MKFDRERISNARWRYEWPSWAAVDTLSDECAELVIYYNFDLQTSYFGRVRMTTTPDHILPSYEELNVEEVNISTAALRAGSLYFGKYCEEQSKVNIKTIRIGESLT